MARGAIWGTQFDATEVGRGVQSDVCVYNFLCNLENYGSIYNRLLLENK